MIFRGETLRPSADSSAVADHSYSNRRERVSIRVVGLLGALFLGLATTSSNAAQPIHWFAEQNIDHHQVGHVRIDIDANGNGRVEHFWSNGKQFSGNTFYSVVALYDAQNQLVWSDKQTKGLDGSGGGRAREGTVVAPIKLSPEELDRIDPKRVYLKMGARYGGIALKSVKCCNNGLEIELETIRSSEPEKPVGGLYGRNRGVF